MPVSWTPETSVMGLGRVKMPRRPKEPLTKERYEILLEERIEEMVKRADPETLAETMQMAWDNEGLDWDRPEQIPRLLVSSSPALRRLSGLLTEQWPVPVGQMKVTRDSEPEMGLRDLLLAIYAAA